MSVLIQFRRGSAAMWTSVNPVLADGEPGYEESTGRWKIGDGVTAWSSLSYAAEGAVRVDDLDMGGHQLIDLGDPTTDTAGLNRRTGDARYGLLDVADGAAKLGDDGTLMGANSSGQTKGFGLVTGKGDIVVASAAKILDRLGVGADRQALIADSSQALGVNWADLPFVMLGAPSGDTTGATDIAKIQAVLAANPQATIMLHGGAAAYYVDDSLPYEALNAARILGMGGLTGGAVPPTRLIYTAGDAKPVVSAKSSVGVGLEHLMVLVNNAGYTGNIISVDALEATVNGAGQTISTTPSTLTVTFTDPRWPSSGTMVVPGYSGLVSYGGKTPTSFTNVTIASGSFTATNGGTIHGPDSAYPFLNHVYVGPAVALSVPLDGAGGHGVGVSLNRANDGEFRSLSLVSCILRGRKSASQYSNAHTFSPVYSHQCPAAPIQNVGQAWEVKGSFEELADGSAGAVKSQLGGEVGFMFWGWCGDVSLTNETGDWLSGAFSYGRIDGYIAGGARGVALGVGAGSAGIQVGAECIGQSDACVDIGNNSNNIKLAGACATTPVGVRVGTGCHDLDIRPNITADVTTPIQWPGGAKPPRTIYGGRSDYTDALMATDGAGNPGRISRFSAVYSEALGNTVGVDFPVTVPPGTYRIEDVGGGSGGGGGGSAALTGGISNQVGGAGGGAGGTASEIVTFAVATVLTLHLGAGNIGGIGGAASTDTSGHAGGIGSAGADSYVQWNSGANEVRAPGALTSAQGGSANSATAATGASAGSAPTTTTTVNASGQGGFANTALGQAGGPPSGLAGGGGSGGGPADATHGGLGGHAGSQGGYTASQTGNNTTADGTDGADAPAGSGAGGGGGGAGAPGGKGGKGGKGGSGFIAITQIA